MGFWGKVFGTDKAIEETSKTVNNIFDSASRGIDAIVYTKEEKVEDVKQMNQLRFKVLELLHTTDNSGKALARRAIAMSFGASYLILIFACATFKILGIFFGADPTSLSLMMGIAQNVPAEAADPSNINRFDMASVFLYNLIVATLATPIVAILGYYFAHGIVNSIGSIIKKKNGG